MFSVHAGKTSTPRSAPRIQGRRNVSSNQIVASARQKNLPTADETPLSPVNTRPGHVPPDKMHGSLQRTSSWQSSASAASSASGGGSRAGPVPKPRSTASIQTGGDEVDLAPSRRPGREPRKRPTPNEQAQKPGIRSQSSPGDRLKSPQQPPPPPPVKAATPSRNGVVSGRSGTPRTHQQVDRSLGSVGSPLSAYVDRSGLVFDVRSKTAYRRGRLLGKVSISYSCYWVALVVPK